MNFDQFCERLPYLRIDRSGGVAKPYKPILLAAVVVLIHKGKITSPAVFLDGGLRSAFDQLLRLIFPEWRFDAKVAYPFRHLATDGIWRLIPHAGASASLKGALADGGAAWEVQEHGGDGARGAVIAGHADHKLRYAVRANPLLSLWRYDDELRVEQIAC